MKNIILLIINCYFINSVNAVRLLRLNHKLIGGIDEFGCITGAGYSYCNYTDKCHRFDEPCIPKKTYVNTIISEFLNNGTNNTNNTEL